MEQLYVFGTGHAAVTRCYNTCFAVEKDGEFFMTDAGGGNGILRILQDMNVDMTHIHHIFVTQPHRPHPGDRLDGALYRYQDFKRFL